MIAGHTQNTLAAPLQTARTFPCVHEFNLTVAWTLTTPSAYSPIPNAHLVHFEIDEGRLYESCFCWDNKMGISNSGYDKSALYYVGGCFAAVPWHFPVAP